jgi:tetratricopeptide (TPR) repeat protein
VQTRVDQIENILKDEEMEILFARVASNLLQRGNTDDAIRICEDGLKKYPIYAQAHYVLAACYQRKEMIEEARTEYERVLRYDPNHLNAIKQLAQIYKNSGLEDIYKEYLLKLFTLDPLNQDVIEKVQQIGQYESWKTSSGVDTDLTQEIPKEAEDSVPEITKPVEKEEPLGIDSQLQRESVEIEKIDLSQFDNREDDFTTILEGGSQQEIPQAITDDDSTITLGSLEDMKIAADDAEKSAETNGKRESFESDELHPREQASDEKEKETAKEESEEEDIEDLAELEFEEEDKEEKLTQEDISGLNDTTQISIDPLTSSEMKDEDTESQFIEKKAKFEYEEVSADSEIQQTKIISQTLGEILVSQKKYAEALGVFKTLKENQPQNKVLDRKISLLEKIILLDKK